ncbi:MAG: alkaline phosphatase PhoX, partial [Planctomycetota bacterium]
MRILLCLLLSLVACSEKKKVPNRAPLVSGHPVGQPRAGQPFRLQGRASDAENDTLLYAWRLVEQPPSAAARLEDEDTLTARVRGALPAGTYGFELRVHDGTSESIAHVRVVLESDRMRGAATAGRGAYDVANVDNLAIDADGGIWFGTDGNFGTNGTADALYYLDLDPAHAHTRSPTFGQAFRVAACPSNAEATGPAFNADASTLFFAVQHPGEDDRPSAFPAERDRNALRAPDHRPLSSVVAVNFKKPSGFGGDDAPRDIPGYVKAMIARLNEDPAWAVRRGLEFPLTNRACDDVRVITGLRWNVVVRWLDPLREDGEARFGANNDYVSFLGDGWNADGNPPAWHGAPDRGWLWVNHEYVSGKRPRVGSAPTDQHYTLALFLRRKGVFDFDVADGTKWDRNAVAAYTTWYKRQLGGSWLRVTQDARTKRWTVDRTAKNMRYDATDGTLARVQGGVTLANRQRDDAGGELPEGIAVGIMSDCSGGTTPWG